MDGQTSGTNETMVNQTEVDPWVAAFAALEPESEEVSETASEFGEVDGNKEDGDTQTSDGQQVLPDQNEGNDSNTSEIHAGGLDSDAGMPDQENGNAFAGMFGVTDESIQQYETELNESIRTQAINDIAEEFIKRGIRNNNGVLGATLDDEDICKRDEDGVPHFFNPETGREFTGDNPRREAKQWVDDYNEELARVYNNACEQYEKHLRDESAPKLAVMKFVPKYEKLDDIRKGMFDNIVEDYEIKDKSGDVIGYSCDLDKALNLVEKQIKMIQDYAKQHQPQQQQVQQQSSGPALDMKTSSGAIPSGEQSAPNSLAEAMERLQDRELAKIKR